MVKRVALHDDYCPASAPMLLSPPNSSSDIPLNLTLSWNAAARAEAYRLRVATNPSFSSVTHDQSGIVGTWAVPGGLQHVTHYYSQVNASDLGGTGECSVVWEFTTVVAAPALPTLVTPLDGASGVATNPILRWNASARADSYQVLIATHPNFSPETIVRDLRGIKDTAVGVNGLTHNTLHYWRVQASNDGGVSGWSQVWRITAIIGSPIALALEFPAEGALGVSLNPTLSWNASAQAASYLLQVATSSSFDANTVVRDQSGIAGTSIVLSSALANGTLYYWRVDAMNAGGISACSVIWKVTSVLLPPEVPILLSPAYGGDSIRADPNLSWLASARAASYQVQVAAYTNFSPPLVRDTSEVLPTIL